MIDKLSICKSTRQITAKALYETLKVLLRKKEKISEAQFRDVWLSKLQKNKQIFKNGWYMPPPDGIGVLFATDKDPSRIKFKSLRHKEYWPKNNVYLDKKNGFLMFYASPVNRKLGIIGDFGLNLYFGNNKNIKNNLKKHLEIVRAIFDFAGVGMKLSQIHNYSRKILEKNGFTNEWWISTTDPTGTNYGHTIPGTGSGWTKRELNTIKQGDKNWGKAVKTINLKRKFINKSEKTKIVPGMGLTIEPRVIMKGKSHMPTIYFHTIALFKKNGSKELLTDFDSFFNISGMDYMF